MHPELRKWVYQKHTHTEKEAHSQKEPIKIMDCQNEGPFNPAPPKADDILEEATQIVTGVRQETHGEKERSFAKIARGWSDILGVEVTPHKVALCMTYLKIIRASDGDARYSDHYVDICGYGALAGELALSAE